MSEEKKNKEVHFMFLIFADGKEEPHGVWACSLAQACYELVDGAYSQRFKNVQRYPVAVRYETRQDTTRHGDPPQASGTLKGRELRNVKRSWSCKL
jgi:hypothetical protein